MYMQARIKRDRRHSCKPRSSAVEDALGGHDLFELEKYLEAVCWEADDLEAVDPVMVDMEAFDQQAVDVEEVVLASDPTVAGIQFIG
jgi:hypothetical protein